MRLRNGTKILAALVIAALIIAGRVLPFREWLDAFGRWIEGLGPAGYALYVAAYALVTVLMMPAVLMMIAAGYFFGLLKGVAIVSGARRSARRWRFSSPATSRGGAWSATPPDSRGTRRSTPPSGRRWRIVFLMRLSPLVPFVVSNYFYGLSAIPFRPYVLASWVGMIPLQFLYVSFGVAGREATVPSEGPAAAWKWGLLAVGSLVTVAATVYAGKVVREALAESEAKPAS